MVLAAFQARRDPASAGALLQGVIRGQQLAQREQMEAAEQEQQKRMLAARYMQQVAGDAQQFDDPVDFQNYLKFAEQVGTELGGQPGALRSIPSRALRTLTSADARFHAARALCYFTVALNHRRHFDPPHYHIVVPDRRGAGLVKATGKFKTGG